MDFFQIKMDNLIIFEEKIDVKKSEGFRGQRTIVLPDFIIKEVRESEPGRQLYLTDIGYYPKARDHFRKRTKGCEQYILIYCIEGKGGITIDGRKSIVKANQYFIIPKGVPHEYGSDEKEPWSIYWLHFSGKMASHYADITGSANSVIRSEVSRIEDRNLLFEEMLLNLEMGYSFENINYANICLSHFLASFKYIRQFRQVRKVKEKDVVESAILFMKESIPKRVSLSDIASHIGLSSSHFSLIFRTKTGRSPMDYLMHLRIQKACRMLDTTSMRVSEIAVETGYEDPFYFSRVFKNIMNSSPVQYRKELKG